MLLFALGVTVVAAVLDDPRWMRYLEAVTRHGHERNPTNFNLVQNILLHLRWWLAALPLVALILRWMPLAPPRRTAPQSPPESLAPTLLAPPALPAPPESEKATPCVPPASAAAGSDSPDRNHFPLPCSGLTLGLFALQLVLGCAFLTGTWSHIRERFWFPLRATDDEIRIGSIPRDLVLSRHLERLLPPDAEVFVLEDPGSTPIFLNYYLYPRRLYNPEGPAGMTDLVGSRGFWQTRRQEGFRWVFLHRPFVEPISRGTLIELLDASDPDLLSAAEARAAKEAGGAPP